jgi:hypothetical protein
VLGERCELESFDAKIGGYCLSYPLDWIEGAIMLGRTNAKPGRLDQYVNGCLARWHAAGKPSYEEAKAIGAARSAGAPAPERPVHREPPSSPMARFVERQKQAAAARDKETDNVS